MTKHRQCGAGGRPSRLCRLVLLALAFKLCLLGVVLAEPFVSLPSFLPASLRLSYLLSVLQEDAPALAPAQPSAQALAPPVRAAAEQPSSGASGASGAAFAASANAPAQPQATPQQAAGGVNPLTLEAMNRRQEELNRREQDLRALEQEMDARLTQLQDLEIRLQIMLKDAESLKDEKYKHLVDVLANMKSRQAAEVLETLDEKIAVKVLAGMRGRQAGEILTYATPVKAARLTEALARMQMPLD